jgi:hypothetical protein
MRETASAAAATFVVVLGGAVVPPHKYNAKRTEWAGTLYPSALEARVAHDLDVTKAAGHIRDWGRGEPLELIPGKRGVRIDYTPDFWAVDLAGEPYDIEAKGVETSVWKLKMRLYRWRYPTRRLLIVTKTGERWLP